MEGTLGIAGPWRHVTSSYNDCGLALSRQDRGPGWPDLPRSATRVLRLGRVDRVLHQRHEVDGDAMPTQTDRESRRDTSTRPESRAGAWAWPSSTLPRSVSECDVVAGILRFMGRFRSFAAFWCRSAGLPLHCRAVAAYRWAQVNGERGRRRTGCRRVHSDFDRVRLSTIVDSSHLRVRADAVAVDIRIFRISDRFHRPNRPLCRCEAGKV
jgi:hypothetical protein